MNDRTTRWLQVCLMDRDDLAGLHAREKSQATRLPDSGNRPRFLVEGKSTWEDLARIGLTTSRLLPSGFWPHGMDEAARSASVRNFEAAVYPIWAGIEVEDSAREAKMTHAQVSAPGQVLYECATVHRQDLAIVGAGIKPNRENADQARMDAIRRRDARARGGSSS